MTAPYIDPRMLLMLRGMQNPSPAQQGLMAQAQPPRPNLLDQMFGVPGSQGLLDPQALKAARRQGLLQAGLSILANADKHPFQALAPGLQAGQQGYQGQMAGAMQSEEMEKKRRADQAMQDFAGRVRVAQGDPDALMKVAQDAIATGAQYGIPSLAQGGFNLWQQSVQSQARQQSVKRDTDVIATTDEKGKPIWRPVYKDTYEPVGPSYPRDPKADPAEKPTAAMTDAAKFTTEMARADLGLRAIEAKNPAAAQEVARLFAAGTAVGKLPLVGGTLEAWIKALRAETLSEDGANYLAHMNAFINAAIPERGGKQLTITELNQYLNSYVPDFREWQSAQRIKVGNRILRIKNGITTAGSEWARYAPNVNWAPPNESGEDDGGLSDKDIDLFDPKRKK